jgi:hypothetical protein
MIAGGLCNHAGVKSQFLFKLSTMQQEIHLTVFEDPLATMPHKMGKRADFKPLTNQTKEAFTSCTNPSTNQAILKHRVTSVGFAIADHGWS